MFVQNDIFTVASAQLTPIFLNKKATVDKACGAISEAGGKGARLIVFPEVFISGYPDWVWVVPNSKGAVLNDLYLQLLNNSVTLPDEATKKLCQAAKKAKINVIMGMHERNSEASGASLYNTLLFIDDNGEILGKRRKLMPTGGERLIWASGDGSTFNYFEMASIRVGGLICWENYMPLARQTLYASGIQILAAPTWDKSENWLNSLRHIAREGGVFVISCCSVIRMEDIPDKFEFKQYYPAEKIWINGGNSCIINPMGEYLVDPLAEKEEILYTDIDLSQIISAKRMFDAAGHYARPDVFKLSINKSANTNLDISS